MGIKILPNSKSRKCEEMLEVRILLNQQHAKATEELSSELLCYIDT